MEVQSLIHLFTLAQTVDPCVIYPYNFLAQIVRLGLRMPSCLFLYNIGMTFMLGISLLSRPAGVVVHLVPSLTET
jgi:hypothetical protein